MKIVSSISDLRVQRSEMTGIVGFVPTMGFLHEGHLSLVREARKACPNLIASIFVNPAQFGPGEDLDRYPRDLPRDLGLLSDEGVDLVWTPERDQIYPPGFQTWVTVEEVSQPLEGAMRPGHFRGVATVVAKLFNVVQPDIAYFGQKDAQQAVVIHQMVRDLNFNIDIIVCPIQREPDGLAMSSRNVYLNPTQRKAAPSLYRALSAAQKLFDHGERSADTLRQTVISIIQNEPLARIQYVSCADPETLREIAGTISSQALLSLAVFFGTTRLIDNVVLGG